MTKTVQFSVIGPFEVRHADGNAIEFSHRKLRALLAYLALERGRPQAREQLASLLWSRTGEDRARHNLRQALSKIRGLCPELIETDGYTVTLNPTACTIDAVMFDALSQADKVEDLHIALDLYRGDLLEGYSSSEPAYQDWLSSARERLRKRACEIGERLAARLREQALDKDAIKILQRLLQIDPANETAHRGLMELHALAGRRSQALRQYQDCIAALARELDAEPDLQTQQLFAEIRENRFAPPTTAIAPASTAKSNYGLADNRDQPLPRKLAAILYADAARYSSLTGEDEDATHRILRRYLDLIANRVKAYSGRIAHYAGDAVLAQFDAVGDALSCALEVQLELGELNAKLDESRRVRFRIGVNSGDVIEDRGDIYGEGVNVAARLEALAEPGGICVSDAVRVAVGNRVPVEFLFIGEQQVKNIAEPVRSYRVVEAGRQVKAAPGNSPEKSHATLTQAGKPSLVIKPFTNMSADPEQHYFAEGLTKDIGIALVKIPGLFLIITGVIITGVR